MSDFADPVKLGLGGLDPPRRRIALHVALSISVTLLLSGCIGDDGATKGSSSPARSSSIADATMQLRVVEAVGYDLPLSCRAAESCSPEILLDPHGVTLEGPEDLRFRLGDLLITGSDVARATMTELPMVDEGEQGDRWGVIVRLTKDATTTFESATTKAFSASPPRNQIALVIDGAVLLAPTVLAPIENGLLEISSLSRHDAQDLAERLGTT